MSGLESIGVRVEHTPVAVGVSSGVAAIATEIAGLLDRLAADGEAGAIDLRSLPMTSTDRVELEQLLGTGEVTATIDADGVSTVRETGIAGVWWTEHRDRRGERLAELIEICRVPEILVVATDVLPAGARVLRERIAARASRHES